MGLGNDAIEEHINVLFGDERANELREKLELLPSREREAAIVEALTAALRELGANYVLPFCFKDEKGSRNPPPYIRNRASARLPHHERINGETEFGKPPRCSIFGYCPASAIHPLLFELNRPLDDLEGMLLGEYVGLTLTTARL